FGAEARTNRRSILLTQVSERLDVRLDRIGIAPRKHFKSYSLTANERRMSPSAGPLFLDRDGARRFCPGLATTSPNCREPVSPDSAQVATDHFGSGSQMSRFGALTAMMLGLVLAAYATDASADEATAAAM